ncbi:hypothetical protein L3X38_024841 [Prunus dulcis]|uniref:Uncharacterized protein n=1 Tax=Prunus dulcis TaxID=3755 RepID=A0AAD4W1N3_PRUDU|nr:hypothetical protein L3X38_024841 [Prunus dulcis]
MATKPPLTTTGGWHSKATRIWDGGGVDPNAVVMQAKAWLAEYQQIRDDLVSNIPRLAPKRWVVPRDGFVKINVLVLGKLRIVMEVWEWWYGMSGEPSLQLVCGQLGRLGVLSKSRRWLS